MQPGAGNIAPGICCVWAFQLRRRDLPCGVARTCCCFCPELHL